MSNTWKQIKFDEDHMPGQRIVWKALGVSDSNNFYYIDEHGKASLLFTCSDMALSALSDLIENRKGEAADPEIVPDCNAVQDW